jgi:hypothetical protein
MSFAGFSVWSNGVLPKLLLPLHYFTALVGLFLYCSESCTGYVLDFFTRMGFLSLFKSVRFWEEGADSICDRLIFTIPEFEEAWAPDPRASGAFVAWTMLTLLPTPLLPPLFWGTALTL